MNGLQGVAHASHIEGAMLMPSPQFETHDLNGSVAMHINSINKSHQLN
jgi:hypothetical protein